MSRTDANAPAMIPRAFTQPGLSLVQIWTILWAYRFFIAATVLITLVLSFVVTKSLPKSYDATATVLIDFQVSDPLLARSEFPAQLAASYMATQIEFIGSPAVLLPVVDKLGLASNPKYTVGYTGGAGNGGLREYAMATLQKSLGVTQAKESRFIYISFSADSAVEAARIANTVAQTYIEEELKRTAAPAREGAERYGTQLADLRGKVDEAQTKITEFRERTGLIDLQSAVLATDRLSDLERRLTDAMTRRREAEARASRGGEGDAMVLSSGLVQNLKSQLSGQEVRLAELSTVLGTRHPDYIALQGEIAATRRRLDREVGVYGGGAQGEVSAARQLERQLEGEVAAQRQRTLELRAQQDEGARYVRELETATLVYQKAMQGYDNVLMGSQSRYSSASIVSPAAPPLRHSKPKTSVNLILGLFAGGFFGVAGAVLWELFHRRIRCRQDLEETLGVPVLAELAAKRRGWLRA